MIDPIALVNEYKVRTSKGGTNKSLVDLIMKDFNSKRPYSPKALEIFNNLNLISNIKNHPSSKKSKLGGNVYFTSIEQMMQRLKLLSASRRSGNNSAAIRNEIWNIINHLHRNSHITKDQYDRYIRKYRIIV